MRAAVAEAMTGAIDDILDMVGEAIGKLLRQELGELERKLGHVEKLLRSMPKLPDERDLPSLRNVN